MRGFWNRLIHQRRTLKVSILSLFLTIFCFAFISIISFTYFKDYKSIMQFSKEVAEQSIAILLAKFKVIAMATERVVKVSVDFFSELGSLDIHNQALVSYLLNVIKYDSNFSNYYIGFPNGSLISVMNQKLTAQKTYLTDPSKLLPKETQYVLRYLDASVSPPMDSWIYLDKDFQERGREIFPSLHFSVLERPWYRGAVQTKSLFWTGFYEFKPTLSQGISLGAPLIDSKGEITAVIGADLSVLLLDDFLNKQMIGKSGKAYILDSTGQIVVPEISGLANVHERIKPELIAIAYQHFRKNPKKPNYILESGEEEFICYVAKLPVIFGSEWLIITAVPLVDYMGQLILMQKEIFWISVLIMILSASIVYYFAKKISTPIVILAEEVNKIRKLNLRSQVRVSSNIKEISLIDTSIAAMRGVIHSFAKYVPKEIVKDLFLKKKDIVLGGEKKEVTIFFSDITGFTSIAESYSIDVLISLLGTYFDEMSKIILSSHGTIDKFLGDGIMAFWGAPIHFPDHASRACTAALRCNAMLLELNSEWQKQGHAEFLTRFGIHTGTVIVGNIGTEERLNYTIIGDAVDMTFRLQEADKMYHTSIIISENVYQMLGEEFVVRPLGDVAIQGKMQKMKIFELMGKMGEDKEIYPSVDEIKLCKTFTDAYLAMEKKNYRLASTLFADLALKFPDDVPTQIYLHQLKSLHE